VKIDSLGNCTLDLNDVVDHLMSGGGISDVGARMFDFPTRDYNNLASNKDCDHWQIRAVAKFASAQDLDDFCQAQWMLPQEYLDLDIETHVYSLCNSEEEVYRVELELAEFKARDLLIVLKALKYLVDLMQKEQILWGVGRGSSVASYCLYLLGVHNVNSIQYNLDFKEFLD